MSNTKINTIPCLYCSGEKEGKPTCDVRYEVFVDGNLKGKIMSFEFDKKRIQVMSDSILGEYRAKYFKTLGGAKRFIIRSKERFIPLSRVNFMNLI